MRYSIKALNDRGDIISLVLNALDAENARHQATSQGYLVLSTRHHYSWAIFSSRSRFSVTLFSQELRALLQAGLPLVGAIEALCEKEVGATKEVIAKVVGLLHEGQSLSQALAHLPAVFPDLYVALVRASERTGNLIEAVSRYIDYRNQVDLVRKKVTSASLYPALLILVGGVVMMFLMMYVVPRFSLVYSDLGDNLPLMSRLLMAWGTLLSAHGTMVAVIMVGLLVISCYGLTRPQLRQSLQILLWRVPALGQRLRTYQLARFYRTLGMLQRGGIPLLQSLTMVDGLLPPVLHSRIDRIKRSIQEGHSLSYAVENHTLGTPIALRLIAVGERSGQLSTMLEQAAQFHDDELSRWVDSFLKLFEPILMAVIGILIGTIIVLMYMPIFELAGSLQ